MWETGVWSRVVDQGETVFWPASDFIAITYLFVVGLVNRLNPDFVSRDHKVRMRRTLV